MYQLVVLGIFLLLASSSSSSALETRVSRLLSWSSRQQVIGWTRECIHDNTYSVQVGWGSNQDSVTVTLPWTTNKDSLASTLWPASLAGAVLCRSPTFTEFVKDRTVLEVGSGLGLTGKVAGYSARKCILTDCDQEVIQLHQGHLNEPTSSPGNSLGTSEARVLDWRDEPPESMDKVDVIVGSDVAYYYYLLRPLMDTTRSLLHESSSLLFLLGQANRECQWDLYHNIRDGCYNQRTDQREEPWEGSTTMLLYNLELETWRRDDALTNSSSSSSSKIDGTIPLAALVHQRPGLELPHWSPYDHVSTKQDQERIPMSF